MQVVTNGAIDLSESALAANLTDDQWSHFQREGYVELGRVLDEAKVEVLDIKNQGTGQVKYASFGDL